MTERKVNDLGGQPAGPVCLDEHPSTLHEKRVDALQKLLTGSKLQAFTSDAMRRAIESNTEEDYKNMLYYDKWIRAVRDLVIEQQLLTAKEIDDRIELLRERYKQKGSL
ncbi:SH3-like domain-containing protein [Zwartia vadi]|uniref:SH3-like domain-containing protein n=1 Tax=Zwartia vadi TaxID=3058168 RepID=UPI0025B4E76B|nr:SH3-like domain-containing protein [Zwartia vadi]MDN3988311.1 nitrile hydratase subunit beta [Zwartia vadi]